MRLIQTLRRDRETLKQLDRKARLQMIWDYYKLPIIGAVCVFILAVLTIAIRISASGTAFYAVFVNAEEGGKKDGLDELLLRSGLSLDGKTIDVSANYALHYDDPANSYADTVQVLAALFGIGDLDIFAADEPVFQAYADKDAFVDLSLFIERQDLDRMKKYTRPGEGGRELVVGLYLSSPSPLHTAGYYSGEVIIGIAANARNLDESLAFVKQLLAETEKPVP